MSRHEINVVRLHRPTHCYQTKQDIDYFSLLVESTRFEVLSTDRTAGYRNFEGSEMTAQPLLFAIQISHVFVPWLFVGNTVKEITSFFLPKWTLRLALYFLLQELDRELGLLSLSNFFCLMAADSLFVQSSPSLSGVYLGCCYNVSL